MSKNSTICFREDRCVRKKKKKTYDEINIVLTILMKQLE